MFVLGGSIFKMTASACWYTFIYYSSLCECSRSLASSSHLLELAGKESYLSCEGVWKLRPGVIKTKQVPQISKHKSGPVNCLQCWLVVISHGLPCLELLLKMKPSPEQHQVQQSRAQEVTLKIFFLRIPGCCSALQECHVPFGSQNLHSP